MQGCGLYSQHPRRHWRQGEAGRVLAVLDVPELQAQVQGAQAGVRQSQAEIIRATNEVARDKANYVALHAGHSGCNRHPTRALD